VRYFAPEAEIPFCGHATIALGAALARHAGSGRFSLILNGGAITVDGAATCGHLSAAFRSPPTRQRLCSAAFLQGALALFGLAEDALDPRLPAAIIHAGADHLLIALKERSRLAVMDYDLGRGRDLMTAAGLATICLIHAESAECFHARNAFAAGGIYEDPATGAAAAALGGYLTAIGWPSRVFRVVQGEDMGIPCLLHVDGPDRVGDGARVSGEVRPIA
jgi:PhzF family phenazine biosynthesis protein